jgi:phosphoribosyl-ATP pyrophosphohydrolase/phosphoribosyl-AMP cyclohydrolase
MRVARKITDRFAGSLCYSKEGLLPIAVCSSESGALLMLAYADRKAVAKTLSTGRAWFYSRSRGKLWKKGEKSGNFMAVDSVAVDCDNDSLEYRVAVGGRGNACHLERESCFVEKFGKRRARLSIAELCSIIERRMLDKTPGSYTVKLASSRKLACEKIAEESEELIEALLEKNREEVAWEACDLIYHALVAARARGVRLSDLEEELARRNRQS